MESLLVSKNVNIGRRRTSLRLEQEFWEALMDICARESLTIHELCTLVDQRRRGSSRTSAIRAFVITYFRAVAGGAGRRKRKGRPRKGEGGLAGGKSATAPILVVTAQFAGPERRLSAQPPYEGAERRLH